MFCNADSKKQRSVGKCTGNDIIWCFCSILGKLLWFLLAVLLKITKKWKTDCLEMESLLKKGSDWQDKILTEHCGKFHLRGMLFWFMTINYLDPGKKSSLQYSSWFVFFRFVFWNKLCCIISDTYRFYCWSFNQRTKQLYITYHCL